MEFTLINSKRKSVALEISSDGRLVVRAPLRYTEAEAREFVLKNEKWILGHLPAVLVKHAAVSMLSPNDVKLAKKGAELLCAFFVDKYAAAMKVKPKTVKITSAKKRFGSCSGENSLCFSYYVMLYPIDAIRYVVVHELAHIKHHDHSKRFHACVKQYLPLAEEYEKLLHPSQASYANLHKNLEILRKNTCDCGLCEA